MAKIDDSSLNSVNLISKTTKIVGNIDTDSDIRIDGELKGNLNTTSRLIVGPSGTITGEFNCKSAEIEGHVEGKIKITELLCLKSTSNFIGDVVTGQLMIEAGANFSGNCTMNKIK